MLNVLSVAGVARRGRPGDAANGQELPMNKNIGPIARAKSRMAVFLVLGVLALLALMIVSGAAQGLGALLGQLWFSTMKIVVELIGPVVGL